MQFTTTRRKKETNTSCRPNRNSNRNTWNPKNRISQSKNEYLCHWVSSKQASLVPPKWERERAWRLLRRWWRDAKESALSFMSEELFLDTRGQSRTSIPTPLWSKSKAWTPKRRWRGIAAREWCTSTRPRWRRTRSPYHTLARKQDYNTNGIGRRSKEVATLLHAPTCELTCLASQGTWAECV